MMERMLLSNEMTRLRRLAQYLHEHRHTHRHITVSAVARHRGKGRAQFTAGLSWKMSREISLLFTSWDLRPVLVKDNSSSKAKFHHQNLTRTF